MNFDFSEEQDLLREQARRFLSERNALGRARRQQDAGGGFDAELWREMAELGWLGAALPEAYGGAELGYVDLCVIAEELGRANAAVPFASSVYLAAEAILRYGSETQRQQWLPKLVSGEVVGAFAAAEQPGPLTADRIRARVAAGKLNGQKSPVLDADAADLLVVLATNGQDLGLYLVETTTNGVSRKSLGMQDDSRPGAAVVFEGAAVEALTESDGWAAYEDIQNRAAILMAFEQIGGAAACLEMARDYSMERYAFGRPIGSFQAIKHKLADVYVATELARSNAYFGAWALNAGAAELPVAAAAARVAGCNAFDLASKENIQTHGGMGFTWDMDCHLYYRRAKATGLALGSARVWKDRLISRLESRNTA
ncbi:MAG: acyl-CoA dehydrogenase family protein [Pseudomonadota bacterium]